MNDGGAGFTVFRPVGTGKKGLAADSTPFVFLPIKQSSRQRLIQGQDSGSKPPAQQGVAALMDELSCSAILGIGHDGELFFDFHHLLSDGQKTLSIYPYILKAK